MACCVVDDQVVDLMVEPVVDPVDDPVEEASKDVLDQVPMEAAGQGRAGKPVAKVHSVGVL